MSGRNNAITMHPRERLDLNEFFTLLTYRCNGNCPFCIETRINEKEDLTAENFEKALAFAHEHDLPHFFLHGGEPTMHPLVVDFARRAKEEGFTLEMFTNGIKFYKIRELNGLLDELKISYRGELSLEYRQADWKPRIVLEVLATVERFPTLEDLLGFIKYAREKTGVVVFVNTLNPVNQYSYDRQYVPYLERMFMELPPDEIYCYSNKATFKLPDGTNARLGNKNLNPGHAKYSMSPDGVIHGRFTRHLDTIRKDSELEAMLELAQEKVMLLRSVAC